MPKRKREADTQGGTRWIDYPTRRKTQVTGIVKGWEDKRDREPIPDTFTQNKNNMSASALILQQLNPYSFRPT